MRATRSCGACPASWPPATRGPRRLAGRRHRGGRRRGRRPSTPRPTAPAASTSRPATAAPTRSASPTARTSGSGRRGRGRAERDQRRRARRSAAAGPGRLYVLDPWERRRRPRLADVARRGPAVHVRRRARVVRRARGQGEPAHGLGRGRGLPRAVPGRRGRLAPPGADVRARRRRDRSARRGRRAGRGGGAPAAKAGRSDGGIAQSAPAPRPAAIPGTGWGESRLRPRDGRAPSSAADHPAERITLRYEYAPALRALGHPAPAVAVPRPPARARPRRRLRQAAALVARAVPCRAVRVRRPARAAAPPARRRRPASTAAAAGGGRPRDAGGSSAPSRATARGWRRGRARRRAARPRSPRWCRCRRRARTVAHHAVLDGLPRAAARGRRSAGR